MSTQHKCSLYSLVILTLLLAGCGFRLCGLVSVAPELRTLVLSSTDQVFNQDLVMVLKTNGIAISDAADYRLRIVSLIRDNKEITRSGGGVVSDYELTATLTWSLEIADGPALFPAREVRMIRVYQYRHNNATASRSEEDQIWRELNHALAINLMHQVATISSKQLATLTARAQATAAVMQQ